MVIYIRSYCYCLLVNFLLALFVSDKIGSAISFRWLYLLDLREAGVFKVLPLLLHAPGGSQSLPAFVVQRHRHAVEETEPVKCSRMQVGHVVTHLGMHVDILHEEQATWFQNADDFAQKFCTVRYVMNHVPNK